MAKHHVAAKCFTLSRHAMGSSSRFESCTPGRACPQSNSENQIAMPGGHQPRLTKLLDFPDMELVAGRAFEHLVTNARSRRLYYLPSQDEALSFVSPC